MNFNNMTECSILDTQMINTISKDEKGVVVASINNIGFYFKVLCNYWYAMAIGTKRHNGDLSKNAYTVLLHQIAMTLQRLEERAAAAAVAETDGSIPFLATSLTVSETCALFAECKVAAMKERPALPTAIRADFMAAILRMLIAKTSPRNMRAIHYCPQHERFFPVSEMDVRFNTCPKCRDCNNIMDMKMYIHDFRALKNMWDTRVPAAFAFVPAVPAVPAAGRIDVGMKIPAVMPTVDYIVEDVDVEEFVEIAPTSLTLEQPNIAVFEQDQLMEESTEAQPAAAPAAPAPAEPAAAPAPAPLVKLTSELNNTIAECLKVTMNGMKQVRKDTQFLRSAIQKSAKRGRPVLQKAVEQMLDPTREMRKLALYLNKDNDHYQMYVLPLKTTFEQHAMFLPSDVSLSIKLQESNNCIEYYVDGYRVYFDTEHMYSVDVAWILVPVNFELSENNISRVIICNTPDQVYDEALKISSARNQYNLGMSPILSSPHISVSDDLIEQHMMGDYGSSFNYLESDDYFVS